MGCPASSASGGSMSVVSWESIKSNFKPFRPDLNGSSHSLRMPKDMRVYEDIDTDQEMVVRFLKKHEKSPDTFRTYLKELYRLKQWAEIRRGKCLSSLTRGDIEDYKNFMMDPPAEWIGGVRNAQRGTAAWRPFTGPLSPQTAKQALRVLKPFFVFLKEANYTKYNPVTDIEFDVYQRSEFAQMRIVQEKCFTDFQLGYIMLYLRDKKSFDASRWRILVLLMFYCGLRIHEVANCKMSDFRYDKRTNQWNLHVIGKGRKVAELPVHNQLLDELCDYRSTLQMSHLPNPSDDKPLIMDRCGNGLKRRRIFGIFKELMAHVAATMPDGYDKESITKMSPHSFRHTCITKQSNLGLDNKERMSLSRHSTEAMLSKYSHVQRDTLFNKLQKMQIPMSA